jgi:hypothetical protein
LHIWGWQQYSASSGSLSPFISFYSWWLW